MGRFAVVSCALACTLAPSTTFARPASSGWFAEGGLGALKFLPPRAGTNAKLGPSVGIRTGRDLFSWLSLGITLDASSHRATVPPPPVGEWFQLYRGAADIRLTGRIDRIALYAEGGVGMTMISSNVLEKVKITEPGQRFSLLVQGGVGFEYQLENRHYSVGIGADGFLTPNFEKLYGIDTRGFLRYTY